LAAFQSLEDSLSCLVDRVVLATRRIEKDFFAVSAGAEDVVRYAKFRHELVVG
jgi:hypothetical protein